MSGVSNYAIAVILCIQTLISCLSSTIGQYIYSFYLHAYPNSSNLTMTNAYHLIDFLTVINNETNKCVQSNISSDNDAELWAQQRSADLFFRTHLASSCPVIIMTYILGLYTSKLGKRFVLLLPMVGTASQITIWLVIIYLHLSEFWWYIAAFIAGLSGSTGVLGMNTFFLYVKLIIQMFYLGLTLNLIITENTIESERSSCFVRFNAMQTAISAMATFGIGYYISWRGFNDLYWAALSLQILAMIIVILFFKSVDNDNNNLNERTRLLSSTNDELNELSSTNCNDFLKVITVFRLNRRSTKKSISLFLTLFAHIFYMLAIACFAPFLWILLNSPFCWTSKDVGYYSASGAISAAILSLLGMQVLTFMGASDAIICVISHTFFCIACLWIAFARHSWQLYVGLLISAFSGYQGSLTTSMMSKWLESHERNHAFTFVTEMNTVIGTLGNSFFNWIYARTVENYRNLTLFIAAGLNFIPLILNM
jgi:MFS family permease